MKHLTKSETKMPRDAKSIELANQKAAYIGELLKDDPKLTLLAVRKKVQDKFHSMLNFKRAREAFIAAGGKVRAKHSSKRRRKNAAGASEALPKRGPGRPPNTERRKPGRRAADKSNAETVGNLGRLGTHLVVITTEGQPLLRDFPKRDEAVAFIEKQLSVGTPPGAVAHYERQLVKVNLSINV